MFEFNKANLKQKEYSGKEVTTLNAKNEIVLNFFKALHLKGAPISYNVINSIAKRLVVANDRTMLVEHGEHLKFTDNWAKNILNKVQRSEKKMVKQMATTSKIPIAPGLPKEEQLTFQRKIQTLIK